MTMPKKYVLETKKLFKQGLKKCSKCNEVKTLVYFYKRTLSKDGYNGVCIKCIKKCRVLNKEIYQKHSKKYYRKNKHVINKKQKNYYKNNKDKFSSHNKTYYVNNRSRILYRNKNYLKKRCSFYTYIENINDSDPSYLAKFKDKKVFVRCYYCKKYYSPTNCEVSCFLNSVH